ncbi:MAG: 30S ribosomal protein S12 methylthiotransferase RimO [Desulfobacteraceae bacterium]
MIVFLETLGCARNRIDSEVMAGRLEAAGHLLTDDPCEAETIIVNTCGFISDALEEAVDTIIDLAGHKTGGNAGRLIVTGCLAQRYKDDDLVSSLPEVDVFLGTGACDQIVDAVEKKSFQNRLVFPDPCRRDFQGFPLHRKFSPETPVYIKVSEGCSRKCTYCIIPKLRGPQRSRPAADIVCEAEKAAGLGAKEIILAAENTTDYGRDLEPNHRTDLAGVLTQLSGKTPGCRVRLLYTHPASLTESIIDSIIESPGICNYFDVPVQHAASGLLKRMGRPYTTGDLYHLFSLIRKKCPEAALRTTLITGFPGETDDDFHTLMEFVKNIRFDHLGVFTYSDSQDLASHRINGHVPGRKAAERHDALMAEQAAISLDINKGRVGKTFKVLVEENPDDGIYLGRTEFQAPEVDGLTFIYHSALEIGTFVDVKITEAFEYDIAGIVA